MRKPRTVIRNLHEIITALRQAGATDPVARSLGEFVHDVKNTSRNFSEQEIREAFLNMSQYLPVFSEAIFDAAQGMTIEIAIRNHWPNFYDLRTGVAGAILCAISRAESSSVTLFKMLRDPEIFEALGPIGHFCMLDRYEFPRLHYQLGFPDVLEHSHFLAAIVFPNIWLLEIETRIFEILSGDKYRPFDIVKPADVEWYRDNCLKDEKHPMLVLESRMSCFTKIAHWNAGDRGDWCQFTVSGISKLMAESFYADTCSSALFVLGLIDPPEKLSSFVELMTHLYQIEDDFAGIARMDGYGHGFNHRMPAARWWFGFLQFALSVIDSPVIPQNNEVVCNQQRIMPDLVTYGIRAKLGLPDANFYDYHAFKAHADVFFPDDLTAFSNIIPKYQSAARYAAMGLAVRRHIRNLADVHLSYASDEVGLQHILPTSSVNIPGSFMIFDSYNESWKLHMEYQLSWDYSLGRITVDSKSFQNMLLHMVGSDDLSISTKTITPAQAVEYIKSEITLHQSELEEVETITAIQYFLRSLSTPNVPLRGKLLCQSIHSEILGAFK